MMLLVYLTSDLSSRVWPAYQLADIPKPVCGLLERLMQQGKTDAQVLSFPTPPAARPHCL
jgi:hypothetical protein